MEQAALNTSFGEVQNTHYKTQKHMVFSLDIMSLSFKS